MEKDSYSIGRCLSYILRKTEIFCLQKRKIKNRSPALQCKSKESWYKPLRLQYSIFELMLLFSDRDRTNSVVHACSRCAKLLARREYAQCVLVQFLIEGAIAKVLHYYSPRFLA